MSTYLVDLMCVSFTFPYMNWACNVKCPLIHVYFPNLCENNYMEHIYDICDNFIYVVNYIIFNKTAPRLSKEARQSIENIGDLYVCEFFTYIRI